MHNVYQYLYTAAGAKKILEIRPNGTKRLVGEDNSGYQKFLDDQNVPEEKLASPETRAELRTTQQGLRMTHHAKLHDLLLTSIAYEKEGNAAKAEAKLQEFLTARSKIRNDFPDPE